MYFVHTFAFTLSLSGTKVNDPSAAKALACFMEKATMLSSLKWGSSVFTIIQVILWSLKVSSSFYSNIKPMIKTVTLQFTYMYARHAYHTPVQWQLRMFTWALELNHWIQIFLSKCNIPEYFQLQHFNSNNLMFTRFTSYDFNGATFCCFSFHDYRIDRCGLQLKEFVELAPLLPKLSQLEALRYNSCSKHSFTRVYISSQWGRVPLFLQHSNREICSLKLHKYIVQPLYPLFTMGVCFISHSPVWIHWNLKCISLIFRFSLLEGGTSSTYILSHAVCQRITLPYPGRGFKTTTFIYGPLPSFLHSHCIIAA